MRLMTPPLPAASRPSKRTTDLQPLQAHPLLHLEQLELQPRELVDVLVLPGADRRRLGIAENLPAPLQERYFLGVAS